MRSSQSPNRNPSPSPNPSRAGNLVETLCEMGFSRALAEEVLAAHGNDAQAALDWLAPVQTGR